MAGLLRQGALAVAIAVLAGCVAAPPPPVTPDVPLIEVAATPSAVERAIERRRAIALKLEKAQHLGEAATQWEIVLLLAPDDREAAARLAALRGRMARIVNDELAVGLEALRRGDHDRAQQSLLQVVTLDPANSEAVAALREIDRLRSMRRGAERAARARAEESMTAARSRIGRRPPNEAGEFDVEQSLELLRAGDAKVALGELRRYAAANPRDRVARERIAMAVRAQAQQSERQGDAAAAVSMYAEAIRLHASPPREWVVQLAQLKARLAAGEYEKGVRLMATDIAAAITHFEAALRYAPEHTQAQLRLERARKMQQNLRSIGAPRGGG